MTIMKKNLIYYALLAIVFASCQSKIEQDIDNENPSEAPAESTTQITIHAKIDQEEFKTNYDVNGKMTWVSTDQIAILLQKTGEPGHQRAIVCSMDGEPTENGRLASFTGEIPSGYEATGYALYPASMGKTNESADYGKPFIKIPAGTDGTLASTILIGENGGGSDYTFHTAASVFKVTMTNIPASATEVRLATSDVDNYPVAGDYLLSGDMAKVSFGDGSSYSTSWHSSFSSYLSVDISGLGATASKDFYFNVPVGAYAAGKLSVQLVDSEGEIIFEKSINKSITTVRNELLGLPSLNVDEYWTTLGTGKFHDAFFINEVKLDGWDWASVSIQKNHSNQNKYRVVNPYKAYSSKNNYTQPTASDKYLTFTVDPSTDLVVFDRHATGIRYTYDYVISHTDKDGGHMYTQAYSKVTAKDGSGNPLCIQLAPYYLYSDFSNGYSRVDKEGLIMILFPDYDSSYTLSSDNSVTEEAVTVKASGTNVSKIKMAVSTESAQAAMTAIKVTSYNDLAGTTAATVGVEMTGITTTGKYYLAIKGYDSDGREIFRDTQSLYHIDSDAQTSWTGTFKTKADNNTDQTLTFSASDEAFQGNIKITGATSWGLTGNIYGCFDGTTITFDGKKAILNHANGTHCIGGWDGSSTSVKDIVFTITGSNFTSSDIGIGNSVSISSGGLITGFSITSLKFAGSHTWTK